MYVGIRCFHVGIGDIGILCLIRLVEDADVYSGVDVGHFGVTFGAFDVDQVLGMMLYAHTQ